MGSCRTAPSGCRGDRPRGAGRAFCSGADFDDPPGPAPVGSSPETRREAARFGERAVREARPVTVARVHGHAIGGGLLPAAANDIRVAEAARELILLGTEVPAPEAKRPGLVHDVADGIAALDAAVAERVSHTGGPPATPHDPDASGHLADGEADRAGDGEVQHRVDAAQCQPLRRRHDERHDLGGLERRSHA
ncbi:enoyl-CoA hydratase/isomerase family protein [Pseudonocardia benzenivorans]